MKRFIQVLTLTTATVLAMSSSFAETAHNHQQHGDSHQHSAQQSKPAQHSNTQKKSVKPSKDWKVGGRVPSSYQGKTYQVDYKKHQLPAPKKGQKWLKINGEYVLVKSTNHQIVKFNNR